MSCDAGRRGPCADEPLNQTSVPPSPQYLVSIGTGGIKPCVSVFGADQFDEGNPEELALIPRFYNWFYAFVNIGSFFASTLVVWVQTDVRWAGGGFTWRGKLTSQPWPPWGQRGGGLRPSHAGAWSVVGGVPWHCSPLGCSAALPLTHG